MLYLGRPEEAARIVDELEPLARKIGQSYSIALCVSVRAWIEFGGTPDLGILEAGFHHLLEPVQKTHFAFWETFSEVELGLVDFFRGNWASALAHLQASCGPEIGISIEGLGVGAVFRQMAYAGDRGGALAVLEQNRMRLPRLGHQNTRDSWLMLALVVEGLVILGESTQAAEFYPLAQELLGTGAVALWQIFRFARTATGIAAAAGRHWEIALDHFQIALQQAESFPYRLEGTEIRRFYAMMLLDRAAPGDREKAEMLLGEAIADYTFIGMPRHIQMSHDLLD